MKTEGDVVSLVDKEFVRQILKGLLTEKKEQNPSSFDSAYTIAYLFFIVAVQDI